jgi:hypothetical protein
VRWVAVAAHLACGMMRAASFPSVAALWNCTVCLAGSASENVSENESESANVNENASVSTASESNERAAVSAVLVVSAAAGRRGTASHLWPLSCTPA